MKNGMKGLVLVFVILYVISPIDICPGPIDDILLMVMAMGVQRRNAVD